MSPTYPKWYPAKAKQNKAKYTGKNDLVAEKKDELFNTYLDEKWIQVLQFC